MTIPARQGKLRTILCGQERAHMARNPRPIITALITGSQFINQTWNPVSLELKNTEVRAYRADPVQHHILAGLNQNLSKHTGKFQAELQTNNHALTTQSRFINQTWDAVSLELKDTEVRAYRTDPVQHSSYDSRIKPESVKTTH
ncbi:hypothetical protein V6N13_004667 [Hibiscus sabdariffa]